MIGTRVTAGYRSFDVMNPHDDGASLDVFVDWLIQAGNNIRRVDDYDEWLSRFQAALTGLPEAQRRQSVLPLLHAFSKPHKPIRGAEFVVRGGCGACMRSTAVSSSMSSSERASQPMVSILSAAGFTPALLKLL